MATQPSQTYSHEPAEPVFGHVPPLETGDCLTLPEFERRYDAMPDLKKAELIEGVVFVGSPVGMPHADRHASLLVWLGTYAAQTPGVQCADNASVRLDPFNAVQPDALLRLTAGGQTTIEDEKYLKGLPELVAEVASSSVSRDLHLKLALYRKFGAREYFVWRVLDNDVDWFYLEAGDYQRIPPDERGVLRSRVFPGLWLDKPALLRADMSAVLATLNEGLASPEHERFAAENARRG